jgi:hypothetical protein
MAALNVPNEVTRPGFAGCPGSGSQVHPFWPSAFIILFRTLCVLQKRARTKRANDADKAEEEGKGTKSQSSHIVDLVGARTTSRHILLANFNLYTHKCVFWRHIKPSSPWGTVSSESPPPISCFPCRSFSAVRDQQRRVYQSLRCSRQTEALG